jgi:hypothetical protein
MLGNRLDRDKRSNRHGKRPGRLKEYAVAKARWENKGYKKHRCPEKVKSMPQM